MIALLRQLSWPELRHHPWRNAAALVAVMTLRQELLLRADVLLE